MVPFSWTIPSTRILVGIGTVVSDTTVPYDDTAAPVKIGGRGTYTGGTSSSSSAVPPDRAPVTSNDQEPVVCGCDTKALPAVGAPEPSGRRTVTTDVGADASSTSLRAFRSAT